VVNGVGIKPGLKPVCQGFFMPWGGWGGCAPALDFLHVALHFRAGFAFLRESAAPLLDSMSLGVFAGVDAIPPSRTTGTLYGVFRDGAFHSDFLP
jgi:hypothetical protein